MGPEEVKFLIAMVIQTGGIVAGFFMWIRKVEREILAETKALVEKAVKDQERIYDKLDEMNTKITNLKIETMQQLHSVSQSLLRIADKVDFTKGS